MTLACCLPPLLLVASFTAAQSKKPLAEVPGKIRVNGYSEPMVLYTPDPQYTEEARKAQIKGSVNLWILIGEDGCARDIRVSKSLGYGLDESAVAALKVWRFRKLEKPARVMVEVNFYPYQVPGKPLNEPSCVEFMNKTKNPTSSVVQKGVGTSNCFGCSSSSPRPIYTPDPAYTEEARKAKIKGTVFLSTEIGEDGCARDISVSKSLGYGLDDSAISALKIWRYSKPQKPFRVRVEVNFDPDFLSDKPLNEPSCAEFTRNIKK